MKKYEFEWDNDDFKFLTKLIADSVADKNKKFNCFKNCNSEIEYFGAIKGNNVTRFVNKMLENTDYYNELIQIIITNVKVLTLLYQNDTTGFKPKNVEYKINHKEHMLIVEFDDSQEKNKRLRVKIEFIDIIWCSLLYLKEKQVLDIIHELTISNPIEYID